MKYPLYLFISIALAVNSNSNSASGQTVKAAFRAPVHCDDMMLKSGARSCGTDWSLMEAELSYSKLVAQRQKCGEPANSSVCSGILSAFVPSISYCTGDLQVGSPAFMAPVSALQNGQAKLQETTDYATSGTPFTQDSQNYQIVETNTSKPDEQHLAICRVRIVSGMPTQPKDCQTVAIITRQGSWLRGHVQPPSVQGAGRSPFCPVLGTTRLSGSIDIRYTVRDKADGAALTTAITKMLDNELKLSPEMRLVKDKDGAFQSSFITSGAPLRNSTIIPAWREAVDFDVSLFKGERGISLVGNAHVAVSRTAASNVSEYQIANEAQRGLYASTLDAKVLSAIKSSCASWEVVDASSVTCR